MTYVVDGDIGAMVASQAPAPAGASTKISSVKRLDSDQTISLISPTSLTFTTITWKVRFPEIIDRAFMDSDMKEQQPDDFIDGWTGYARLSSWFMFQDLDNEWFEAHGALDGVWWQFLFLGLGKALFTDGTFSQTVDIETLAWYYVTMDVSQEAGTCTLTLFDRHDNVLASNIRSGLSFPLLSSALGATGQVYNLVGDMVPANLVYDDNYVSPGQWWGRDGSSGYVYGSSWDSKTGQLGTTGGVDDWTWIGRPWWSQCTGLDYTFADNRTTSIWFDFLRVGDVPEGYPILLWRPKIKPDNAQADIYGAHPPGDWMGRGINGYGQSRFPLAWHDGQLSGSQYFFEDKWYYPDMFTSVGYFRSDGHIFLGLELNEGDWGEMPPWQGCGSGFVVPWRWGTAKSWKAYYGDPADWEFMWAADVEEGEDIRFEVDVIYLAGVDVPAEEVVTDENQAMEGWNTEMVSVVDGLFDISATPVRGSVNVYAESGLLLYYGDEWIEAEPTEEFGPGMQYHLLIPGDVVVVVYFVTRPTLGNNTIISRPTEESVYQEQPRATRTPIPL